MFSPMLSGYKQIRFGRNMIRQHLLASKIPFKQIFKSVVVFDGVLLHVLKPVRFLGRTPCLLTYAHSSRWSIGHRRPLTIALCSGLFWPFQSRWSLVDSTTLIDDIGLDSTGFTFTVSTHTQSGLTPQRKLDRTLSFPVFTLSA